MGGHLLVSSVDLSTLGTDCVSTLRIDEMCLVVERVCRRSALLRSVGTLGSGAVLIFGNSRGILGFCLMAFQVSSSNFSIWRISMLLPSACKPLMVLAQSVIASITLSACVTVGFVIFLCWNCAVSMSFLLHVSLIWHACVQ